MSERISNLAKKYGYSKDFQRFCYANIFMGHGENIIARFMTGEFSEEDMIQTVLSYNSVFFCHDFFSEDFPPDLETKKTRITEKGRAKYLSHCDPDGRFRYEDFPPIKDNSKNLASAISEICDMLENKART